MNYLPLKTLYIEVTHACNQHCRHCYLDGGLSHTIKEMTTEQIQKILRDFKEQGGRYVTITGGEPFMREDLFEILDYIEALKLPFQLASNSLAMNEKRLQKLASYKYLDLYFTSILGGNTQKHRDITGKDGYQKVFDTLDFFDKHKVSTYVQVTLAKDYVDDMEEIARQLLSFKHCTVKFTPIASLGIKTEDEKNEAQDLLVTPDLFESFHQKVTALQRQYPGQIENSNILNHDQIAEIIADYATEDLYSLCYGFVAVRPNGDLSFSCNMDNPFVFGKAYNSLQIPIDEKLKNYIGILKQAEAATLKEAADGILEMDVTVDKYIQSGFSNLC